MKLTDKALKALKPRAAPYKVADGDGLFILVKPSGAKLWRMKYFFQGREKLLAVGVYPLVPLSLARDRRYEARKMLAAGLDPSAEQRKAKASTVVTFQGVAEEWLGKQDKLTAETRERIRTRLARWIYPAIGKKPCAKVEPSDVLTALQAIERRGSADTAHRTRADVSRVLRYAVATQRADHDVTLDLRGALAPIKGGHFAAITKPKEAGELLRAIDAYVGQPSTQFALRIAPHVFLRPGELRAGRWSEIDLDAAEWRVPAERMKGRRPHLVPLSRQVIELLRELEPITGDGDFLFPALGYKSRPMSDNTLNVSLRRMGYTREQMTAHGFRSMASSLLNELGVHPDLIELQLAHKPENETRAIYNRSERLAERRAMMQQWSDYLDSLRRSKLEIQSR